MKQVRGRPTVVVTNTISRSAHLFYGQIIDEFQCRGFEVHVVTSDGPEVLGLRNRADVVHLIPMKRSIAPLADLRALWAWLRVLRRIKPAVVFAGSPKASLLSMVAARLNGVPRRVYFLAGLRLEGARGTQRRILAAMERLTSSSSHIVIAVSKSLAVRYQELHLSAERPVEVAHHGSSHGVDTEFFSPVPRDRALLSELAMDPELPIVLFMGRLTADKGPDALIGALHLLRQEGVSLQLLVLGAQDEKDSSRYRELLEASSTVVRVIDHLRDVRPYMAFSHLLALPTRREGMPNVVLEAAAMGMPSVTTTATGAVDSVVDGETGILVPPDDPRSLATAIRRILKDPELRRRMGAAARQRAVTLYQPREVAKAIVDIALCSNGVLPPSSTDSDAPLHVEQRHDSHEATGFVESYPDDDYSLRQD